MIIHRCDGCDKTDEHTTAHYILPVTVAITADEPDLDAKKTKQTINVEKLDLCQSCRTKIKEFSNPKNWPRNRIADRES